MNEKTPALAGVFLCWDDFAFVKLLFVKMETIITLGRVTAKLVSAEA